MAIRAWPSGYRTSSILAVPFFCAILTILIWPVVYIDFWAIPRVWGFPFGLNYLAIALVGTLSVVGLALLMSMATIVFVRMFGLGRQTNPIDAYGARFTTFTAYHLVNTLVWRTVLPFIVNTWLIVLFFRGMGARIGKNCYINTPHLFECPLIQIGDRVLLGAHSILNPHSAENGRIVFGRIVIGDDVEIGAGTIILPDVVIQNNVVVAANSLIPKGKTLYSHKIYAGVPARAVSTLLPAEPVAPVTNKLPVSPQSFALTNDQVKVVLMEAYKIQSAEAADLGKFMVQMGVAVMGIIFSGTYYSIINTSIVFLGAIPPLVGFTLGILVNLSTMMLRNAYKMCEIEMYLKAKGAYGLDWELRSGGLGHSRMLDVDNILINMFFAACFVTGVYFTATGAIIDPKLQIVGHSVKDIVLYLDLFLLGWLAISIIYYVTRRGKLLRLLEKAGLEIREIFPVPDTRP